MSMKKCRFYFAEDLTGFQNLLGSRSVEVVPHQIYNSRLSLLKYQAQGTTLRQPFPYELSIKN